MQLPRGGEKVETSPPSSLCPFFSCFLDLSAAQGGHFINERHLLIEQPLTSLTFNHIELFSLRFLRSSLPRSSSTNPCSFSPRLHSPSTLPFESTTSLSHYSSTTSLGSTQHVPLNPTFDLPPRLDQRLSHSTPRRRRSYGSSSSHPRSPSSRSPTLVASASLRRSRTSRRRAPPPPPRPSRRFHRELLLGQVLLPKLR